MPFGDRQCGPKSKASSTKEVIAMKSRKDFAMYAGFDGEWLSRDNQRQNVRPRAAHAQDLRMSKSIILARSSRDSRKLIIILPTLQKLYSNLVQLKRKRQRRKRNFKVAIDVQSAKL
jgi:hypothetical protein